MGYTESLAVLRLKSSEVPDQLAFEKKPTHHKDPYCFSLNVYANNWNPVS